MFNLYVSVCGCPQDLKDWMKDSVQSEDLREIFTRKDEIVKNCSHDAALHFRIVEWENNQIIFDFSDNDIYEYEKSENNRKRSIIEKIMNKEVDRFLKRHNTGIIFN